MSHAYACCYPVRCQDVQDSDAENANSGETSIKRAHKLRLL
nr:MAG TPA: hypothetical protein [Caudoviricetes sp.]